MILIINLKRAGSTKLLVEYMSSFNNTSYQLYFKFNEVIKSGIEAYMLCIILGCGSSNGVPQISCNCSVCISHNDKNHRLRSSIFIKSETTQILVDTSPDLRQQVLRSNIKALDAVIYTHTHSDHIAGIDDVKELCKNSMPINMFSDAISANILQQRFDYIFKQKSKLYPPRLKVNVFNEKEFTIGDIEVMPFKQQHGSSYSYGFRFGNLAYSTDFNHLPETALDVLYSVEVWIVDCLRYHWSPTHSYLATTLAWIARVQPKRAILTHMGHDIDYFEIQQFLPANVTPAYDGMEIDF